MNHPTATEIDSFPASSRRPLHGGKRPGRARERVMRFLEEQCRTGKVEPGERLPASRTVARQLEVSLTTVQNVFRQLAAEGVVRTEQGNGSFWEAPLFSQRSKTLRIGLTFGVLGGEDRSGPWSTAIAGAITRAAAGSRHPVSIHPVAAPVSPSDAVLTALKKQQGKIDAMILHPVLDGADLIAREGDLGFPVVHLNPGFTTALTNFVSADFYGISQTLGRVWRDTERRRVLFVHNSGREMNASAALRCAGLVAGLGNRIGNGLEFRVVSADSHSAESGYKLAQHCLGGPETIPDAIYLVGDSLATGFCRHLSERGLAVPGEVSVVSGGGVVEGHSPLRDLTRTLQPAETIGETLLEMAAHLAEGDTAELPGKFIPCSFVGGETTTPQENHLLGITPP